jgi:hypothetical protein
MGLLDSVLANTVGAVYRGATGSVDPWTLQAQKDQIAEDTRKALGPRASDAEVLAAQVKAQNEVDAYLKSVDAHPDEAGVRIPGLGVIGTPEFLVKLQRIVYGLIAAGAVVGAFYFSQRYGSVLKKTFRKR